LKRLHRLKRWTHLSEEVTTKNKKRSKNSAASSTLRPLWKKFTFRFVKLIDEIMSYSNSFFDNM
jgi:hypothetical protein